MMLHAKTSSAENCLTRPVACLTKKPPVELRLGCSSFPSASVTVGLAGPSPGPHTISLSLFLPTTWWRRKGFTRWTTTPRGSTFEEPVLQGEGEEAGAGLRARVRPARSPDDTHGGKEAIRAQPGPHLPSHPVQRDNSAERPEAGPRLARLRVVPGHLQGARGGQGADLQVGRLERGQGARDDRAEEVGQGSQHQVRPLIKSPP